MSDPTAGSNGENGKALVSGFAKKTWIPKEPLDNDMSSNIYTVSGGLSRKNTLRTDEKTVEKRLCGKVEMGMETSGLSRKITLSTEEKNCEKRLYGNVLDAPSPGCSISYPDPNNESNGSKDEETGSIELVETRTKTASTARGALSNSHSIITVFKHFKKSSIRSSMVETFGANTSEEIRVKKKLTQEISIKKIQTKRQSIKKDCDTGSITKNTIRTYISTIETDQRIHGEATALDPSDIQEKLVSSPSASDENAVALYLCADWMRYRQGTVEHNDQVLYEKTIVSLLPEGVWAFGESDSGKAWSLSVLWDEQDKGINVDGSVLIGGHSQNITAEYILTVILMLVKKDQTLVSGNLASSIFIGVPYWFDSRRRQQILNAAQRADFSNCRIFNENSLSAYYMYSNQRIPKNHELVIFSVNSNKIDVSVYRSTDYATAVLVGSCGNYEYIITRLKNIQTNKQMDPLDFQKIQLAKAVEVAVKKAEKYGKMTLKRFALICAKDELIKSQEDLISGVAKKIPNMQYVRVENEASFYSLLDIASNKTFLKNESKKKIVDGRPFNVKFGSNEQGFETVSVDRNYMCGETAYVVIPADFITSFIFEVIKPDVKYCLGRLDVKNAVDRNEILVGVKYNDNGILMVESARGRSRSSTQPMLNDLEFEWFPEGQ